MSYYQTQQYNSYPPQTQQVPPQAQQQPPYGAAAYANVQSPYTPYQASPSTPSPAYPVYTSPPVRLNPDVTPPGEDTGRVIAPEFPDVNPQVACHAMHRLISSELQHAGFDNAQAGTLELLELEAIGLIETLFRMAHDYANHSGRARPIATDLMVVCKDIGFDIRELHEVEVMSKKRRREGLEPEMITLLSPPSRSPSPELLGSDDEDPAHPVIPVTLRSHPHYLPPLPPKHTYLRTPAAQPRRSTLPSLEKKLKNASLVQSSLENLLDQTEVDDPDPIVKMAFGNVVNWESGQYARKRWKVFKK
ncbi:hypothetical protein EIP86_001049 [Pleurotus ostreatoroseus]|nr:hypothetical protein EIP86_001049 [Pleurotus ostreatoroseus]